ncbi:MAG: type I-U CRISPR-associated protein Cas5/Cas6 [Planctomycetaceae bacterium]|nr:type I-U CRISPR-associated protein Cas5/Cas6 [Planctomycetaceae bacterium]
MKTFSASPWDTSFTSGYPNSTPRPVFGAQYILDPVPQFHGRGSDGEPEWPPSPLRLFQSLVAAAATRWRDKLFNEYAQPALQWLETAQPSIVTPGVATETFGYRMYVPNNSGDLMTAAWARGDTETSMAKFRVEKDVRPSRLRVKDEEPTSLHFLYPVTDSEIEKHRETLISAARSITHLGWGVDMVAGNAAVITEEEASKLTRDGERWQPVTANSGTPTQLRVPRSGTLQALIEKHDKFLNRLSNDGFRPVPPLTAFNTVGYRRETDPVAKSWVAFRINSVSPDDRPPAFETARRCRDVAAWVRHATGIVCGGWPFEGDHPVASFVHGHNATDDTRQLTDDRADQRFMFLPLPTINSTLHRVESIRRVLIAAPPGFQDQIDWLRRRLSGQELVTTDGEVKGLLNELTPDWVVRQYTSVSRVWSTVTPVILHRHDTHDAAVMESLIRQALRNAGLTEELTKQAEIEWRNVGFRAGVDLATRYVLADRMTGPRYHVRVRFPYPIPGPLAVGAGRYRGFGLFAAET